LKVMKMDIAKWLTGKKEAQPAKEPKEQKRKRPKIDRDAVAERARKNSPWRYDDGPVRRGRI
jgi:hypothetical protein